MPQFNFLQIAGLFFALCLLPVTLQAEEVAVQLPGGLKGLAEYRRGAADKPAVLVLHGFLQTHRFSTVRLIVSEVADAGYPVLSPTLTLNIDQRHNSLTCDAIQNHSVEQASREIGAWVDWLKKQGHPHIILIGHSTGSDHLLNYLHNGGDSAISAFIATSVGPLDSWQHPEESRRQQAEAEAAVAMGDTGLKQYSLGFCRNNYMAPPKDFLSYMQWDRELIVRQLHTVPVPTTVVLGQSDNWLPPGWADTIEQNAIPLVRINDANHYFSGIAEFDFQAAILSLVEAAAGRAQQQ
jgi:pimeloyl-ACP methyl ester carboxylesterase